MAWSQHRPPLPPDWEARRVLVFSRDGFVCQLHYEGVCTKGATEVDHIDRNDDHTLENLRAVCHACHTKRTQAQAAEATRRLWAQTKVPRPPHPGLL